MKQLMIAFVMFFFSLSAMAAIDVDTRGLSDTQKAELVKMAESMKTTPVAKAADTVEAVDKWVNVGERIGKMMGGAAKEVGVAVNQFIDTPVGKMTAAIIVWNYMGGMVVHVISGWVFLLLSWSMLVWFIRRNTRLVIQYDKTKERNWLGRYPIISKQRDSLDDNSQVLVAFGFVLTTVVGVTIMFAW